MTVPAPTLWIDVDDLVQYLVHHDRPSGIQRVTFEICQALHRQDEGAGRVRFVRRGSGPRDLVTLQWERLDAAFRLLTGPRNGSAPADAGVPLAGASATATSRQAMSVAADLGMRRILRNGLALQGRAVLALAKVPGLVGAHVAGSLWLRLQTHKATRKAARRRSEMSDAQYSMLEGVPLKELAAPGDSFVVLGSPWIHRDYAQTVRWVRDERRMRFALLIYDLVPLRRPEWCDRSVITSFVDWHRSVLPLADQIFTISRATADDVVTWTDETGMTLHNPVQPVPMGTGLGHEQKSLADDGPSSLHLPVPGTYVLFVSTLEARKNHALLFRVWRRLLAELPPEQVPTLVFAGRVGWLVADLMQQLENAAWLGGKIRLVRNPTDAELMMLYQGCQFTLFPSLFEGWGLPVSESLALGLPCVISNRSSLPEAGGDLARYFDPENLDEAFQVIRAVIVDPAGLAAWRQRIAREFRHVPWSDSAVVVRRTLDALNARETSGL